VLLEKIEEESPLERSRLNCEEIFQQIFEKYVFNTDKYEVAHVTASRTTHKFGVSCVIRSQRNRGRAYTYL
jgi:hypothetical protein